MTSTASVRDGSSAAQPGSSATHRIDIAAVPIGQRLLGDRLQQCTPHSTGCRIAAMLAGAPAGRPAAGVTACGRRAGPNAHRLCSCGWPVERLCVQASPVLDVSFSVSWLYSARCPPLPARTRFPLRANWLTHARRIVSELARHGHGTAIPAWPSAVRALASHSIRLVTGSTQLWWPKWRGIWYFDTPSPNTTVPTKNLVS
jgi:hypothetical protein